DLERKRQFWKTRLDAYAYPVSTLPNEIISEIFVHSLPDRAEGAPSGAKAPLLLAQICHKWREIVLSTPSL
ncbi:hypothetical protein DFH09DRAFT_930847, partial [Mycena vulgaris]